MGAARGIECDLCRTYGFSRSEGSSILGRLAESEKEGLELAVMPCVCMGGMRGDGWSAGRLEVE